MPTMRAKMKIQSVTKNESGSETLRLHAVAASKYPEDGSDENNTYAKYSPSASLEICICNPNLYDKFVVGQEYYLDFTLAEK